MEITPDLIQSLLSAEKMEVDAHSLAFLARHFHDRAHQYWLWLATVEGDLSDTQAVAAMGSRLQQERAHFTTPADYTQDNVLKTDVAAGIYAEVEAALRRHGVQFLDDMKEDIDL